MTLQIVELNKLFHLLMSLHGYYAEVFMIQQRKGKFIPIYIEEVNESNLEEIIKWLTPRWDYLKLLWKPIS